MNVLFTISSKRNIFIWYEHIFGAVYNCRMVEKSIIFSLPRLETFPLNIKNKQNEQSTNVLDQCRQE